MARHDDEKKEHPIFGLAVGAAILFVFGFLIWLVASNRIVYGSLKPSLFFGAMWKWFPSDYGYGQWNWIVAKAMAFAPQPHEVSFVAWATLVTVAFRPVMALVMATYLVSLLALVGRRKIYTRRFTAKSLMEHSVRKFTGIAPVVAIRKQIAANKHPKWRKQVTPEEVFQGYRVPGNVRSLAPAGAPMVREGKFDREVARAYFTAVSRDADGKGLMRSGMLGRQVVNLVADRERDRAAVFADRMSSEGKALLALWAAVAFGGTEGRQEFCKYRDMLNLSAYGTKDGMANLALVQPLYDKYRRHPMLNKIFAIHHWEHTVLFFLLSLAQRKGRFTTAEVLWLRPTNRVMYFALNSRGAYTPHTEAAATFGQFAYEVKCAKQARLPLVRDGDALVHVLYVDKAVDGLELEYARWAEGSDDDDDWWLSEDVWKRTNATLAQEFARISAAVPTAPMPGAPDVPTAFDEQASRQAEEAAAEQQAAEQDELGKVFAGTFTN